MTTIHTDHCIRATARQEAYDLLWSDRCDTCKGAGGAYVAFDPSPGGRSAPSLAPGTMTDFDSCSCLDEERCPRCAQPLMSPAVRGRLWLAKQFERLATRSFFRPHVPVGRFVLWRTVAAFRENPTPLTWALYHAGDKLFDALYSRFAQRPPPWARLLWWICERLERDCSYSETPCHSCGWGWNSKPGDARDPHVCECGLADFEAEHDDAEEWAEREREQQRATGFLVGLPGGPIPVRHIFGSGPRSNDDS